MYPPPIQKLIDLFTKLPGIGPRQASRFVFHLLKERALADELSRALQNMHQVSFCTQCFRTCESQERSETRCTLCRDPKRLPGTIAVIEKEADMQNIEKTGMYQGLYHVLGGVISPLDSESPQKLHLKELYIRVKTALGENGTCEVILATNPTTEGDTTALYLERILAPLKEQFPALKMSRLGRGLSLGSELEYADEMTLKSALNNRK